MKALVEIKLTTKVAPNQVDTVVEALMEILRKEDAWNGSIEYGEVEIVFNPFNT